MSKQMDAFHESDDRSLGGNVCTQIAVVGESYIIDVERHTDAVLNDKGYYVPGDKPSVCQVTLYSAEPREEIAYLPDGDDMPLLQDFIEALGTMGISIERCWKGDVFSDNPSYYS